MKRFLALSLCIMLALSAVACAKEPNAAELYDKAVENHSKMDSVDMTISTVSNTMQQGISYSQSMDYDFKASGLTSQKITFYMTGSMTTQGQKIDTISFYKNGYYYLETLGEKVKFIMDFEALNKQVQQSTGLVPFTSADMKELTVKKQGTDYIITFTPNNDKVNEYLEQYFQGMNLDNNLVDNFGLTQLSGEFVVNKDGYFSDMELSLTAEMVIMGQTFTAENIVNTTIKNPGQPVEISLPSTDGYTEVDASAIGMAS